MATAYTSLLGLALPVTGELSGTWGTTVNTEITALLDSAVAGTTTISADADITLTTTTGAANEAREAIILWTAGGTTTRNITAPAQSKTYIVINKSSSTQSIVLRGAGPTTGVTIIKGEAAVCAWNGSDFVKVASTVITNLTGTLPVVNGGTGVTTSTGSGNVVLSTSPTLVTPILGTPTSGTVTNLTGTASININGTVGATTASTGAFTTLSATGVTTVQAGTAALPAITTTGDTNTGIFFPAADTIAFSEGGAEAMRIDSSGNVLVGGTSIPGSGNVRSSIGAGLFCFTAYQSGTTAFTAFQVVNGNGEIGSITTSATTTSYNTSSDYRLKENIAPMTGALAKVALLKPCTYEWKVDGSEGQGFIAHELDEVVPGCVTGEKDAVDADGNPKYQGIDTSFLVATLTAAIQEQQSLITSLTARVAALEAN